MIASAPETTSFAPADVHAEQVAALTRACHALWSATLALMVAFMNTPAPAHRLLLAKRIARNYQTLRHEECFTEATRASFARLASRWDKKVIALSSTQPALPGGRLAILSRLFTATR